MTIKCHIFSYKSINDIITGLTRNCELNWFANLKNCMYVCKEKYKASAIGGCVSQIQQFDYRKGYRVRRIKDTLINKQAYNHNVHTNEKQ